MNKAIFTAMILVFTFQSLIAQYDNTEKLSILGGFTATGSEFVFYTDNVYGGNLQLVYDVLKIQEGAIGIKASGAWSDGYSGYYGGLNFRVGSRFFGDTDVLYGYSSISNPKLLGSYIPKEHDGGAFIWNIGIGFRFPSNPFLLRMAFIGHFPIGNKGLNSAFNLQVGYRIK